MAHCAGAFEAPTFNSGDCCIGISKECCSTSFSKNRTQITFAGARGGNKPGYGDCYNNTSAFVIRWDFACLDSKNDTHLLADLGHIGHIRRSCRALRSASNNALLYLLQYPWRDSCSSPLNLLILISIIHSQDWPYSIWHL